MACSTAVTPFSAIFICNKFVYYYYLLFNQFLYYYHLLLSCITVVCRHAISTTGPSLWCKDCHTITHSNTGSPADRCLSTCQSVPVKPATDLSNVADFGGSLASSPWKLHTDAIDTHLEPLWSEIYQWGIYLIYNHPCRLHQVSHLQDPLCPCPG